MNDISLQEVKQIIFDVITASRWFGIQRSTLAIIFSTADHLKTSVPSSARLLVVDALRELIDEEKIFESGRRYIATAYRLEYNRAFLDGVRHKMKQ